MSRDLFSPAERAALDRATAPALAADFADAVVSAAMARPAAVPPRRPIGLNWRAWKNPTRMFLGLGALALAGATAAAAGGGLLDRLPERFPQLVAAVGLAPAPAPPRHVVHVRKVRPPAPTPTPSPAPVELAAPLGPPPLTDEQIAIRRARIAAYRAAVLRGDAPPLRPVVRRALAERVRERIADLPPERRAELRERLAAMTPEQRTRARVRMEVRFLNNHPRLAERLVERSEAMAGDDAPPPGRLERLRAWRERQLEARAKGLAAPPVEGEADPAGSVSTTESTP